MTKENNNGADYNFKSYSSNVFRYLNADPDKAMVDDGILNNYEKSITEDLLSGKLKKVTAHDIDAAIALVKKRQNKYSSLLKELSNDANNADRTTFRGDIENLSRQCDNIVKLLEKYKQEVWAIRDTTKKETKALHAETSQRKEGDGKAVVKAKTKKSGEQSDKKPEKASKKTETKEKTNKPNEEREVKVTTNKVISPKKLDAMKVPSKTSAPEPSIGPRKLSPGPRQTPDLFLTPMHNPEPTKEPTALENSKKQMTDMLGKLNPPISATFENKYSVPGVLRAFKIWNDSIDIQVFDDWTATVDRNDISLQSWGVWAKNAGKEKFYFATVEEVKVALEALQKVAVPKEKPKESTALEPNAPTGAPAQPTQKPEDLTPEQKFEKKFGKVAVQVTGDYKHDPIKGLYIEGDDVYIPLHQTDGFEKLKCSVDAFSGGSDYWEHVEIEGQKYRVTLKKNGDIYSLDFKKIKEVKEDNSKKKEPEPKKDPAPTSQTPTIDPRDPNG